MGPLDVLVHGLPDVVEEPGPEGDVDVGAELAGHHGRQHGHFLGVLEHVLPVARPVFQLAEKLDQLGVDVADPELEDRRLALLLDLQLEVVLHGLDDLLDPGRVDPAVGHELLDGQAGQSPGGRGRSSTG